MKTAALFLICMVILSSLGAILSEGYLVVVAGSDLGEKLYFHLWNICLLLIVVPIFWSLFLFIQTQELAYAKFFAWGLICEALLCGVALFLPFNLQSRLREEGYSDFQASLIYFFAPTPAGLSGIIAGMMILNLVSRMNRKRE